jgi:hypothetical protein
MEHSCVIFIYVNLVGGTDCTFYYMYANTHSENRFPGSQQPFWTSPINKCLMALKLKNSCIEARKPFGWCTAIRHARGWLDHYTNIDITKELCKIKMKGPGVTFWNAPNWGLLQHVRCKEAEARGLAPSGGVPPSFVLLVYWIARTVSCSSPF